ncbi:MAG: flagellar motor switch protein FliG [Chloroflexi bacterium]|jgi:flagellar motor switch protein FliG|nr:flagellar motor switch protein FliG [Chloroflexota bacterium]
MSSDKLSGRQKAAVLLIALGPENSANVLKRLREPEIEEITLEILSMEQVSDEVRRAVIQESYNMALASRYLSSGGLQYAEDMLNRALGPEKAGEFISRIAATLRPQHFAFLRETDPAQLANFLQEEQPQAIALILAHLPPTHAARVLSALPADIQPEIGMRVATMERTLPEVIEGVESVLRQRLSRLLTSDYSAVGGVDSLVKILANVDRHTERGILEYLDAHDPELAEEVRKQMFSFENLVELDDHGLQRVLREVDARDLALALRGANEQLKERVFRNISARAAEMLQEDMAVSGPVRRIQVEEAQQRIVNVARRLEQAGEIVIQRGADDVLL